ncbi:MAG: hypothetical protein PVG03_01320 [Desulfarculaceae bacterium]|jgi:hypothetical protein
MKARFWIAAALVALALAVVAGVLVFPRFQAWQLERALTREIIPQAEKYLSQETGRTVKITYSRLEFLGKQLVVHDLAMKADTLPPSRLEIKRAILSRLVRGSKSPRDWKASARLEDISGRLQKGDSFKVRSVRLEDLSLGPDGRQINLAGGLGYGISLEGEYSLDLKMLEVQDLALKRPRHLMVRRIKAKGFSLRDQDSYSYDLKRLAWTDVDWPELKQPATMTAGSGEGLGLVAYVRGTRVVQAARIWQRNKRQGPNLSTEMQIEKVRLEAANLPEPVQAVLKNLNVPGLTLDFNLLYGLDQPGRRLWVDNLSIWSKSLGRLDFSVDLNGITWEATDYTGSIQRSLQEGSLVSARLAYADQSLVRQLMQNLARAQGISLPEYKSRLTQKLRIFHHLLQGQVHASLWEAAFAFIQDPGSIEIQARPPQPVPLSRLRIMNPAQALKAIRLRAKAR